MGGPTNGIFVELAAWLTAGDAAVAWAWSPSAEDALTTELGVENTLITKFDVEIVVPGDAGGGSRDGDESEPSLGPEPRSQVNGPIRASIWERCRGLGLDGGI